MEAGLRTALDERMRSERMKVELITNVSHDLKTPLTSIISYAELLKQEDDLPEAARTMSTSCPTRQNASRPWCRTCSR